MSSSGPRGRGIRDRFDSRLLTGLALVAASMLGVLTLVTAVDDATSVWVTRAALVPGQRISDGDLVERRVRLGDAERLYASASDGAVVGSLVQRAVPAGELVPVSALGEASTAALAPVMLSLRGELSRSITPGGSVDVWATRPLGQGAWSAPAVIVPNAIVVRISEPSGMAVGGSESAVEVLVPRNRLAAVLEAKANGDALALVTAAVGASKSFDSDPLDRAERDGADLGLEGTDADPESVAPELAPDAQQPDIEHLMPSTRDAP